MRTYASSQTAVSVLEAFEACEVRELSDDLDMPDGPEGPTSEDFRDLFLGPPGESAEQSTIRREVARAVLEELLTKSADDEISLLNAVYAAQLSSLAPLRHLTESVQVTQGSRVKRVAA